MWFNGNGDTNMMNNLNNHDIFDFSLHSNIMQQGTETQPAAMTVSTAGCSNLVRFSGFWFLQLSKQIQNRKLSQNISMILDFGSSFAFLFFIPLE